MYMIQILETLISFIMTDINGHKWIERFHHKCSKPISHPAHTFGRVADTIFFQLPK